MNMLETDQLSDLQQENSANASEIFEDDLSHNHDARSKLKLLRLRNIGRVIIGYLNINSIRNKFDALRDIIAANIDILLVAETKIDSSFPKGQFLIDGFAAPYRLDRNKYGGGLLVYVRSNIPSKLLTSFKFEDGIECVGFEINLTKKKWAIFSVYRPPTQPQQFLFENLGKALDHYSSKYENFMFLGDFNAEETDEYLQNFLNTYSMKKLVKEPTCYKTETQRCIDLILTNRNQSMQHTTAIETGLSDFHKMVVTVLKTTFPKQGPSIINYRSYKNFDQTSFKQDLRIELDNVDTSNINYGAFETAFDKVLNEHAPLKKKYVRANDAPFMTKALRKAVMLRTRLRNKYNQNRIAENWNNFRRQRNLCVKLFQTEKKRYYNNLDVKLITDNKKILENGQITVL